MESILLHFIVMKSYLFSLIILSSLAISAVSTAMPSTIVLLRHGEEPTKGDEGRELSNKGWQRAQALPTLLLGSIELKKRGSPQSLIAVKPHKKKGSIRAIQTLQPLAAELSIEIQAGFTRDQIPELVQYLAHTHSFNNKTVYIAWQHDTLGELAHALGARNAPNHWPSKAFDRLWILDFKNGQFVQFLDLPQRLLKGDSKN